MQLYITRHGETAWNKDDRVCGWPDVDLTEEGMRQAQELSEKVKGRGITRILVSPLRRARITAEIANQNIQVPMVIENRLIEQCFGDFEGMPRSSKKYLEWKKNITCRYPGGGESILDLCARVYQVLDEIPERYPGETVLLVCHGVVSRAVHTYFANLPVDGFGDYKLKNCELKCYDYEKKMPRRKSFTEYNPLL